ncbi:Component of scar regulatory complex [Phytophthora cinnamomi]|nr:Component of scar regulatory complex [Phytophthora cinnamomi]
MHMLNSVTDQEHDQGPNDTAYEVLVDGIAHICKWKSIFLLFMAWKYQNPKMSENLREAGIPMDSPFLEYERVIKHNYSDEEWQAMAQIIYGVKSVVQILREFQSKLAKCVRRTIYHHIQVFVQHTLLPILHRADKRKLACTKLIHDIRAMCGDWIDSELLASDFKKKHKERKFSQIPDRTASASLCQIQMLRTAIDSMYAKRSMGDLNAKSSTPSAIFSFKKDLDSSDAESLQEFYHKAGAFPVLLNLSTTLDELADFSCLWFREQYLELAKSVQIPAEISLPWLLIEHSLDAAVKAAKYGALEKTITGTHRAYFGEPHIQALCELLPKRELLAVANDCIDFAVTKIEDVLALCIPALGSTIPPFRLPRFMYRTEGCYGYFEGKFKHLLDSDELEAQIFHCFREIGNALMFLLVLGTIFNVNAIQSNATQQPVTSTERLPSLFQCALERIDSMLKSCNRPRGGGDDSMEQGELLSVREMFGDGVQLAGCTLVHLLGQRTLYDLWNVSQHVLNVRHYEEVKTASETQVALVSSNTKSRQKGEAPNLQTTVGTLDRDMEDKAARFVVNAREMRATSKQMFHTLELAWPSGPRSPATFAPPPFTPPLKTPSSPLGAQYHR